MKFCRKYVLLAPKELSGGPAAMGTQVKGDSHRATRGTNNQVRGSMETGGGTGQRALVLILAHLLSLLLQRYSLANPFLLACYFESEPIARIFFSSLARLMSRELRTFTSRRASILSVLH